MGTYKLSGFADEITPSFVKQLESMHLLDMSYLSLRQVNKKNIIDFTTQEIQDEVLPLLQQYNINVSSISSPIGKIDIHDEEAVQKQLNLLPRLIEICTLLQIKYIRIFSYYNVTDNDIHLVLSYLRQAVKMVEDHDVILLHENEKDIFGDTPEKCLYLCETINHPQFQAVYDPANFVQVQCDPIQAYHLLQPYIRYVHLKDAMWDDGSNVLIGTGDAKIPELLSLLQDNDSVEYLAFEPHLVAFDGLWLLEQHPDAAVKNVPTYEESFARFKDTLDTYNHLISKL